MRKITLLLWAFLVIFLAACGGEADTAGVTSFVQQADTAEPATSTPLSPTSTAESPTDTPLPPTSNTVEVTMTQAALTREMATSIPTQADITPETPGSGQTSMPYQTPSLTATSSPVICSESWFFSFPFEFQGHCPQPAVVSQAAAQPYEHGLMIWLEQPGRYFVLTNQILFEGEQRKVNYVINDPLDITADTSADYLPPEGLYAPAHGFGLVWRGDVFQSSGFQDILGWATASEFGYEASFQCESPSISGGRSWQFCFLRAPNGDVIVFHALDGWMWLGELERQP